MTDPITTPEQMREAAIAALEKLTRSETTIGGQRFALIQLGEAVTAIRAISIAPHSEAAPDNFDALVADAFAEAMRAMKKFPQPNYVISKIAEEAGEVVKAAIHCAEGRETAQNLRDEMKQLIAMLYRLWIEGDGVHNLGSVSAALIDKEATP